MRLAARILVLAAGAVLVFMACALALAGLTGAGASPAREPVLGVAVRHLAWGAAGVAAAVAALCLFGGRARLAAAALLWLGASLGVYFLGLHWIGQWGPAALAHLTNVPDALGAPAGAVAGGAMAAAALLVVAGAAGWVWGAEAAAGAAPRAAGMELVKMECAHCAGRVSFPQTRLGESLACPHCQRPITLARAADGGAPGRPAAETPPAHPLPSA